MLIRVVLGPPSCLQPSRRLGETHFDERLERIRDIRASERVFYQKIADICVTNSTTPRLRDPTT